MLCLLHPQQECNEDEIGAIRSTPGPTPSSLPRLGERQVFNEAVAIRKDDWEPHQPACDTIITVYEYCSSEAGNARTAANEEETTLRAVVYYPKMASYAEVSITSFVDLRQVRTVISNV